MPGPPPSKAPKGSFGDVRKSPSLSPALPAVPVSLVPPISPAVSPSLSSMASSPKPTLPKLDDEVFLAEVTFSGILKKKSQKNRHLWNARYVELRGRDLIFYRSKADAAINRAPVIALFEDIIQVEIPKVGRGVDEGTRFNIRLHSLNAVVSANPMKTMRAGLLELQAPDPKACHQWTAALQKLGVKITEGPLPSDMLPEATESVSPDAKAQLLLRFGGHLKKKSRKMRGIWVSRYMVISDQRLSYYRAEEDARDEINPTHLLWSDIKTVTVPTGGDGNPDQTKFIITFKDRESLEWQGTKDDCKGWMLLFDKKLTGGNVTAEPALPPRPKSRGKSPSPSSSPSFSPSSSPSSSPAASASVATTTTTSKVSSSSASTTPSPSPKSSSASAASPFSTPTKSPPSSVPKVIEVTGKPPLPGKPVNSPVIVTPPPSSSSTKPVADSKVPALSQEDRLRELLRAGGPVKKKGIQYPHNWHPRYMIVVDEQLCYYANSEDCVKNINAKVVPLFDVLSLKVPTRGKGAADGLRFNMEMVGGSLLEWQALSKEATHDWALLFEKFGITESSGKTRAKTPEGPKEEKEKVAIKSGKTEKATNAEKPKEEKKEEKQPEKEGKPVYQPSKSRTGVYTIKPVIGLRVVTHENKGVLVAAVTAEPAQTAGLQKGDIVKTVNGSKITSEEDCLALLKSAKIDDKLVFVVSRAGADKTCTVTVGIKEPETKSKFIPKALRAALETSQSKPKSTPDDGKDAKQCALCERTGHTSRDHECAGCRSTGLHRGRYCPSCPPAVGLSWDEGPGGCTVTTLDSGCAAEIAGLKSGDLLQKIETAVIESGLDIRKAMEGVKPGQTLEFRVLRAGKHETINVRVLAKKNKKFGVKNLVDNVKAVRSQITR